MCKACPAGHTCPDKCSKVACPVGKHIVGGKCVAVGGDKDKPTTAKPGGTLCPGIPPKKLVGGKCVPCGFCETCDGTATVKPNLCPIGQYRDFVDLKCKACPAKHTCTDKCSKVA